MQNILVEKEGKEYLLDRNGFFSYFEVEYLDVLSFENERLLKKMIKACQREKVPHQLWCEVLYGKELSEGFFSPQIKIQWIDPVKGYGVFAKEDIFPFQYLGEYTGHVRLRKRSLDKKNPYCFEYFLGKQKSPYLIDAFYGGNFSRFMNHSSSPNVLAKPLCCQNIVHCAFFSKQHIPKGTELTYDYGETYWKEREKPI